MDLVRSPIAFALVIGVLLNFGTVAITAVAQTALDEPGGIDPVAAAIAADDPSVCDDIGVGLQPADMVATDFRAELASCHQGLGGTFIGGCLEPFAEPFLSEEFGSWWAEVPSGKAKVRCTVSVWPSGQSPIYVDPADFYIIDHMDRRYAIDQESLDTSTFPTALGFDIVAPGNWAQGRLYFTVDSPLDAPFLLAWRPSFPPHQRLAVVVIGRPVPFGESEDF